MSDTDHFGGMKDSIHKQACLPKQTSESSYSVACEQNMEAISEIQKFLEMSFQKAFLRQNIVLNAVLRFFLKKKRLERECELINA